MGDTGWRNDMGKTGRSELIQSQSVSSTYIRDGDNSLYMALRRSHLGPREGYKREICKWITLGPGPHGARAGAQASFQGN